MPRAASSLRTPSYRLHKASGQAVVTLGGRDRYLGRHGSPESQAEYDRLIAEWLASGRRTEAPRASGGPTVNEVILAYLEFADGYYVKDGCPTSEPKNIRLALKPVRTLYGHTAAEDFGPLALKVVRDSMIAKRHEDGRSVLCRNEVNKRVRRITRMFKWGVSQEMVAPKVHHGLASLVGLRRGRTDVRESKPVGPVSDADVDAIAPYVSRQVWAMVELQRLSAMRPGEVCAMRTADVERSGDVWVYRPGSHKTEHHGRDRTINLGPKAQEILRPWLRADPDAHLFSPNDAIAEWQAAKREGRKSKVQPSQRDRSKRRPTRSPGARYTVESYCRAIKRACKWAKVDPWHPNMLRHSAATRIRAAYGLESAQCVLGHASANVTQVYAERDQAKARTIMAKIG